MNKIILGLLFLFVSLEQALAYDIQIKTLPEEYYLFRPVGQMPNPSRGKPSPEFSKILAIKGKAASEEMHADAKKFNLKHVGTRLSVFDYKKGMIVMSGIPVTGPNLAMVPREKLKKRPAGKYFVLTYSGARAGIDDALDEVRVYVVKNKLKLVGDVLYWYFKKPTDPLIVVSPVE